MDVIQILKEVRLKAVRSSGAGGQHVNKVSTKIQLFFVPAQSAGLSAEEKDLLLPQIQSQLNEQGEWIVQCSASRSQHKNREEVQKKLIRLLQKALQPKTIRLATKVPKSVVFKRLDAKRKLAEKKLNRRLKW